MPQSGFYAKVRRGMPELIAQWRRLGQGDPDRLALILAETARVARLGEPEATPDGATLEAWSEPGAEDDIPLWAARTATFLLIQMPARPVPKSDDEACAWAYCWLRNRDFASVDEARAALPDHLQVTLTHAVGAAWADRQGLRLI
ncbi:hypothetical protein HOP62_12175 [Halomonas sp. MCCC 1A17488]|uniref:DUF4259 domain-containing protein n=1 Tax=Billgrantia sulfidoxydans TaxID=2733484 RepID=A0ABX7WA41_9GAMM|nr:MULTISPECIES: hypothetical protein [Halomonas]MCE8016825.1 hypothetical protein [Halomonas sp. MCCC 1A17488]MCG3240158.1 hypothetical protein [Halomonas sp. MCCC 1A17488]QPP51485.1 hypothetical protein I4484_02195 [Halomonas sp. SS10-MC5]QTP56945.1 hypothetical protein HNO51_02110 [Halomonas sulfidoxydans]